MKEYIQSEESKRRIAEKNIGEPNHPNECKCFSGVLKLHGHDCPLVRPCKVHGTSMLREFHKSFSNHVYGNVKSGKVEPEKYVFVSLYPSNSTFHPGDLKLDENVEKLKLYDYTKKSSSLEETVRHRKIQTKPYDIKKHINNDFVKKTKTFVQDKTNKMKRLKQCFHSPCNSIIQQPHSSAKESFEIKPKNTQDVSIETIINMNDLKPSLKYFHDPVNFRGIHGKGDTNPYFSTLFDNKHDTDSLIEIKHKKGTIQIPSLKTRKKSTFFTPNFCYAAFEEGVSNEKMSPSIKSKPSARERANTNKEDKQSDSTKSLTAKESIGGSSSAKSQSDSSGSVFFTPFILMTEKDENDKKPPPAIIKQKEEVEKEVPTKKSSSLDLPTEDEKEEQPTKDVRSIPDIQTNDHSTSISSLDFKNSGIDPYGGYSFRLLPSQLSVISDLGMTLYKDISPTSSTAGTAPRKKLDRSVRTQTELTFTRKQQPPEDFESFDSVSVTSLKGSLEENASLVRKDSLRIKNAEVQVGSGVFKPCPPQKSAQPDIRKLSERKLNNKVTQTDSKAAIRIVTSSPEGKDNIAQTDPPHTRDAGVETVALHRDKSEMARPTCSSKSIQVPNSETPKAPLSFDKVTQNPRTSMKPPLTPKDSEASEKVKEVRSLGSKGSEHALVKPSRLFGRSYSDGELFAKKQCTCQNPDKQESFPKIFSYCQTKVEFVPKKEETPTKNKVNTKNAASQVYEKELPDTQKRSFESVRKISTIKEDNEASITDLSELVRIINNHFDKMSKGLKVCECEKPVEKEIRCWRNHEVFARSSKEIDERTMNRMTVDSETQTSGNTTPVQGAIATNPKVCKICARKLTSTTSIGVCTNNTQEWQDFAEGKLPEGTCSVIKTKTVKVEKVESEHDRINQIPRKMNSYEKKTTEVVKMMNKPPASSHNTPNQKQNSICNYPAASRTPDYLRDGSYGSVNQTTTKCLCDEYRKKCVKSPTPHTGSPSFRSVKDNSNTSQNMSFKSARQNPQSPRTSGGFDSRGSIYNKNTFIFEENYKQKNKDSPKSHHSPAEIHPSLPQNHRPGTAKTSSIKLTKNSGTVINKKSEFTYPVNVVSQWPKALMKSLQGPLKIPEEDPVTTPSNTLLPFSGTKNKRQDDSIDDIPTKKKMKSEQLDSNCLYEKQDERDCFIFGHNQGRTNSSESVFKFNSKATHTVEDKRSGNLSSASSFVWDQSLSEPHFAISENQTNQSEKAVKSEEIIEDTHPRENKRSKLIWNSSFSNLFTSKSFQRNSTGTLDQSENTPSQNLFKFSKSMSQQKFDRN